ncbi:hypothetical protein BAE44_0007521 [Dichanthelium oligosanthes]|uniref:F-box domain-containing protein n=1 Tax=Dichanthelium oligosanthes TaxID=888268 RepID=A0A1E5W289_9POAL|nr:hypothetical protein BAE44_0007521 [Dichanthelium oligosanthes]
MIPEQKAKLCSGSTSRADTCDRLSDLPDGILHVVMSFLPARHAVQTSVLSRRWRNLWCSMPSISINEREFEVRGYCQIQERWDEFEDFITNLLSYRCNSVSLDRFQIYAHSHSQQTVDRWIRHSIEYCPTVLKIEIPCYHDDAPLSLKLPYLGSSFCRLKKLSLSHLVLDNHFAELLCSGCSALVDLELVNCFNCFQHIASTTLTRLVVNTCFNENDAVDPMVITAPSLAYLKLVIQDTIYRHGISVCNVSSLVEASIYMQYNEDFPAKYQRRLLSGLFSVTSLELTHFETMAMLNKNSDGFPIFLNMRYLSLESCFLDDECDLDSKLEDLGSFLENAPCLEKLTLQRCMFCVDPDWEWDVKRKSINLQRLDGKTFHCLKLQMIEVLYEDDHEHLLVELLWGLARRLPDPSIKLTKIFR